MEFLSELEQIIAERAKASPDTSYTAKLLSEGLLRLRQKVGEEAVETILACEQGKGSLAQETADLFFHVLVLLYGYGVTLKDVEDVLRKRHQTMQK